MDNVNRNEKLKNLYKPENLDSQSSSADQMWDEEFMKGVALFLAPTKNYEGKLDFKEKKKKREFKEKITKLHEEYKKAREKAEKIRGNRKDNSDFYEELKVSMQQREIMFKMMEAFRDEVNRQEKNKQDVDAAQEKIVTNSEEISNQNNAYQNNQDSLESIHAEEMELLTRMYDDLDRFSKEFTKIDKAEKGSVNQQGIKIKTSIQETIENIERMKKNIEEHKQTKEKLAKLENEISKQRAKGNKLDKDFTSILEANEKEFKILNDKIYKNKSSHQDDNGTNNTH